MVWIAIVHNGIINHRQTDKNAKKSRRLNQRILSKRQLDIIIYRIDGKNLRKQKKYGDDFDFSRSMILFFYLVE